MDGGWIPFREFDTVVIVNFGGQYAHLIARRVRELNVYSEIVNYTDFSVDLVERIKPRAIILSGGPSSIIASPSPPMIGRWILDIGLPVLGICYGHQLLAYLIGGRIERGVGEYGRTEIEVMLHNDLFNGWGRREIVWMSHSDYVADIPKDRAVVLAKSVDTGYIAAFKLVDRPIYGVQFHPEVHRTPKGRKLIENFVVGIARARQSWSAGNIIDRIVDEIKASVGRDEKVLCAVSGGVDSTVTALLLKRAVGDRLVAVFVNHGLLREGEDREVLNTLRSLGINPIYIYRRLATIFECS